MANIGEQIREARKRAGMTREAPAEEDYALGGDEPEGATRIVAACDKGAARLRRPVTAKIKGTKIKGTVLCVKPHREPSP